MRNSGWHVKDNMLRCRHEDGSESTPPAKEIFEIVFGEKDVSEEDYSKELKSMLSFSRFPLRLELEACLEQTDGGSSIVLMLFGGYGDQSVEMPSLTEHFILDNTWHPIDSDDYNAVKNILNATQVSLNDKLTLGQFLEMLKADSESGYIRGEISSTSISSFPRGLSLPSTKVFKGTLYDYQKSGYNWLKMIYDGDAGGILADEMGLGKTVQIIALISQASLEGGRFFLVVVPATVMENWSRELRKFAPGLHVLVHQGGQRKGNYKQLMEYDVVIASYQTMVRDLSMLKMIDWDLVVLDEAQAIKNPFAERTLAIKQIPRRVSIAVTGTPFENNLMDIWSITDFAYRGFLGNLDTFMEKHSNSVEDAKSIEPRISPIILRRKVEDVAGDLPEKIIIPQALLLDDYLKHEYEFIREKAVNDYKGGARLGLLTKLRQFCTHPFLVLGHGEDPSTNNKYLRLLEILEEIFLNGEKVLLFTSFLPMIDILVQDIPRRFEIKCFNIDGRIAVSERQGIIDRFQESFEGALLVLNPRAAGQGLNITAANHVIHLNPEWNPAVEDQATARAFRRGQTKPVTVHRLYFVDTIEDVINERISQKRNIAEHLIVGHDGFEKTGSVEDLLKAIMISPFSGGSPD